MLQYHRTNEAGDLKELGLNIITINVCAVA
jgi:hypothetical protein